MNEIMRLDMITKTNQVIKDYFESNPDISKVRSKVLMPQFIKAGIFSKDNKGGSPIRNKLRYCDRRNQLDLIQYVYPDRKKVNTHWYFTRERETK